MKIILTIIGVRRLVEKLIFMQHDMRAEPPFKGEANINKETEKSLKCTYVIYNKTK